MSVLYLHICFLCVSLVTFCYTVSAETIKSMLIDQQDVYMAEQICSVFFSRFAYRLLESEDFLLSLLNFS